MKKYSVGFRLVCSPLRSLLAALGRCRALGVFAFCAAALLAGCASTKVDVAWTNPEFASRRLEGKVLVVGLTHDETMRRVYEDEMVARLTVRGVSAIRSYEVVQGLFGADGNRAILDAARRQGAGAVLTSAVVGHEHIARMTIDEPVTLWQGMYEGWYGHYWPYLYRRAELRVTERYLASTTFIDVASGKIRWTARTHTDASSNVENDIKDFAGVVLDTIGKAGLL